MWDIDFRKSTLQGILKRERDLPRPEVSHATKSVSLIEPYACNSYLLLHIIVYPYDSFLVMLTTSTKGK